MNKSSATEFYLRYLNVVHIATVWRRAKPATSMVRER